MHSPKKTKSIRIKSATYRAIERGFGLLKRQPGDQPFPEEWVEHKQREIKIDWIE